MNKSKEIRYLYCDEIVKALPDISFDSCCTSCHDDADEGYYQLLDDVITDGDTEINLCYCCPISRGLDMDREDIVAKIKDYVRTHDPLV